MVPREGGRGRGRGRARGGTRAPTSPAAASTSASECRFGWGCTRDGCWYTHPHGRESANDPHPIAAEAAGLRGTDDALAKRAARFQSTSAAEDTAAAAAAAAAARPFAPTKESGRSRLVVQNKEEAMRRFYVRLLRSGAAPTEAQQRAVTDLGMDLATLGTEARDSEKGEKDAERELLKAKLQAAEAVQAARRSGTGKGGRGGGAGGAAAAAAAKRRKLDSDLETLGNAG